MPQLLGGINRAGAFPTMLRAPATLLQPPLDLQQILSFPVEAQPMMGLFSGFNLNRYSPASNATSFPHSPHPMCLNPTLEGPHLKTDPLARHPLLYAYMDPVQKAVMNHTFGVPLIKTKRPVISCNVCQIRFNSESQAEAHYKGNRHARRVKGIEAAKTRQKDPGDKSTSVASPTSSVSEGDFDRIEQQNGVGLPLTSSAPPSMPDSPVPPPCPPPVVTATPELRIPFVEQKIDSPAELAPCESEEMEAASILLPSTNRTTENAAAPAEPEDDKAKKLLYCSLCKVAVNSLSQLEAHNKGTKHKTILEARSGLGPIKAYPRLGLTVNGDQGSQDPGAQERTFHCEICNVKVNSEVQLKQHISSRRHRDGVAGKPNLLLSRHKKQRTIAELATSMVFQKDLPKTLAAGLLPNPLAFAAAMAAAANSPLALRPAPTPPLLQAPHHLTHPLLRSAPGPIRTSHGPILFSPY
ncbi:zinc finger protein 385A isoform X3 [Ambystoma mexicanum]|uniref:zinc finger protein 385A isoform X3 n=1 Tax=Ambystoma mexicanum TaxID=8296 RepID=UPI0037E8448A